MPDGSGALWRILGAFPDSPRKCGSGYEARCPAHEDRHASLSIGMGLDGRVVLHCHAGCPPETVVAALGLGMSDLFEKSPAGNPVRRFRLLDTCGKLAAVHVREDVPGDKKLWWESHGKNGLNGTTLESLPPYRLPDVLAAEASTPVVVCEGEKAADALAELGLLAVGTVTGANKTPSREVLATLRGRPVWLWPDNDPPGREHMQKIAAILQEFEVSASWVDWNDAPPKGDAADYVLGGGTAEGVRAMVREPAASLPSSLVILRPYSSIMAEEVHWLWQGRIALGKLTVLMGDPGLGKSLLTVHAAGVVSTGGTWPDGERCQRAGVIILTAEDGAADTVRPRLDATGADVSRVFELQSVKDAPDDEMGRMFQLATDIGALELAIKETGARLVILDPLNAYLGGVDSHKAAEVRGVLAPLAAMTDRTGVALLVLHHLNKGTSANALYRAGGSLDFVAAARSVLGVVPDPDRPERRLLVSVKINIAVRPAGLGYHIVSSDPMRATSAPIIQWDNEVVKIDPLTAFAEASTPEDRWQRREVKDMLLELLQGGEAPAEVVKAGIRASGVQAGDKLIRSVSRELGVQVVRRGFGSSGQWVWVLPKESPTGNAEFYAAYEPSMPSMAIGGIDGKEGIGGIESADDTRARARHSMEASDDRISSRATCRACGKPLVPGRSGMGLHFECRLPYKEN